jgi:hypothetical protein
MEYETIGLKVSEAIEALQNIGVSLNDYDSEALDIVLAYALAKLKDEQEPYKWPNP